MAYEEVVLFAFNTGEISEKFDARPDLSKYDLGAKLLENFLVDYTGSILSRQGTEIVGPLPASQEGYKLFTFQREDGDYTVVLTHQLIRFIYGGEYVLEAADTLTNISCAGNTLTLTGTFSGYAVGDLVKVTGVGNTEVDNRYCVVASTSGTTLTLTCAYGVDITAFSAVAAGSVARVYTVASPYDAADFDSLNAEQRLDDLYITSVKYARRKLTYTSAANWSLTAITLASRLAAPTNLAGSASSTGSAATVWAVTAVDSNGVEGDVSARLVYSGHVNYAKTEGIVQLTWDAVAGATEYYVYRSYVYPDSTYMDQYQELGYVGKTLTNSFSDPNIIADFTKAPPQEYDPFAGNNYPNLFRVFQQRGMYLGSTADPLKLWASRPGKLEDYSYSNPLNDGDGYEFELDAKISRPIKHAVTLRNSMLIFTSEGVSQLKAGQGKAVTALNALAEPQAYQGIADTPPVTINLDVVFAERFATRLYAMLYTEYTESFKLQDLSILATHLTGEGKRITRMEYIETPNKLILCLREDGVVLALTYLREQEVFAWGRITTNGRVLDICQQSEGNSQYILMAVEREINGTRQVVLERMAPRNDSSVRKYWGVDAGVRNTLDTPTVRLYPSGTLFACTLKASAAVFGSYSVGDYILYEGGYARITAINSSTEAVVTWELVPFKLDSQKNYLLPTTLESGQWEIGTPITQIYGLWHLEGQEVSVLANGDYYTDTVAGGSIMVQSPVIDLIAGMPYTCRAQTLPLQSKQLIGSGLVRRIFSVLPRFYNTRGVKVGTNFDSDLWEVPARTDEDWGEQLGFADDVMPLPVGENYKEATMVCFEQSYPLPACITGLAAQIDIGEDVARGD